MTLLAIALYMALQFGIGIWVSRRIRTEADYILAGRNLGYLLCTFSIFATWFGAETIVGSAGRAYREGISLASAEPFGYGLCLLFAGVVFAGPLWRRKLTTLADLYRQRFSVSAERLAALVLIPGSIYWAAAQIRAFGHVISASSSAVDANVAIGIAAGFTVAYAMFGGMLVDAITDVIQGVVLIVGLVVVFAFVLPSLETAAEVASAATTARVQILPVTDESTWALIERWAIPIGGSVLATELVGRLLAARSVHVAQRSAVAAAALYVALGSIPLIVGLFGPALLPAIGDEEQLLPTIARDMLPTVAYAIFAGALISAILSTVDSTLLTASSLLSHNIVVPVFGLVDERRKVFAARAGVVAFGVIAYGLALHARGVFALVEQASALGSAGVLVSACFGLFTPLGGSRAALATLTLSPVAYVVAAAFRAEAPFLLSLSVALVTYLLVAAVERRPRHSHAEV